MLNIVAVITFLFLCDFLPAFTAANEEKKPKPVVMWHGLYDHCCHKDSLAHWKQLIENEIPGIYVLSLKIGKDEKEDKENASKMDPNEQVKIACELIGSNENLKGGYNAVGMSQGSQFLRAVAQRCPKPPMNILISLGGQHQGIYGVSMINRGVIKWVLRSSLVVKYNPIHPVIAQYWHDPTKEDDYRNKNNFIAEINNESYVREEYKTNLMKLNRLVLVKFKDDTDVIPKESSWFGFYTPGKSKEITPLRKSRLYLEDRLGLKLLDEAGKIDFIEYEGGHLQFDDEWFKVKIIWTYLKGQNSLLLYGGSAA